MLSIMPSRRSRDSRDRSADDEDESAEASRFESDLEALKRRLHMATSDMQGSVCSLIRESAPSTSSTSTTTASCTNSELPQFVDALPDSSALSSIQPNRRRCARKAVQLGMRLGLISPPRDKGHRSPVNPRRVHVNVFFLAVVAVTCVCVARITGLASITLPASIGKPTLRDPAQQTTGALVLAAAVNDVPGESAGPKADFLPAVSANATPAMYSYAGQGDVVSSPASTSSQPNASSASSTPDGEFISLPASAAAVLAAATAKSQAVSSVSGPPHQQSTISEAGQAAEAAQEEGAAARALAAAEAARHRFGGFFRAFSFLSSSKGADEASSNGGTAASSSVGTREARQKAEGDTLAEADIATSAFTSSASAYDVIAPVNASRGTASSTLAAAAADWNATQMVATASTTNAPLRAAAVAAAGGENVAKNATNATEATDATIAATTSTTGAGVASSVSVPVVNASAAAKASRDAMAITLAAAIASGVVPCSPLTKFDFKIEACDPACNEKFRRAHCKLCKCKKCDFCTATGPGTASHKNASLLKPSDA